VGTSRVDLVALYERYLACCNERRFDDLADFVSDDVGGSGSVDGLAAYVDRVRAPCTGFPDYRWQLQAVVVEGDTLAARLTGHGTHTGTFEGVAATGRTITVQELVVYRFADGKIVQCWGDLLPVLRDAVTTDPADRTG
jgi:predicted ester cyclase